MISVRRTCQNQICNPVTVVVSQERNLDAVEFVFPPSFNNGMGVLKEKMSPKPQDTLESCLCSCRLKQLKSLLGSLASGWQSHPQMFRLFSWYHSIALTSRAYGDPVKGLGHILSAVRGKIRLESPCTVDKLLFRVRNILAYSWVSLSILINTFRN